MNEEDEFVSVSMTTPTTADGFVTFKVLKRNAPPDYQGPNVILRGHGLPEWWHDRLVAQIAEKKKWGGA